MRNLCVVLLLMVLTVGCGRQNTEQEETEKVENKVEKKVEVAPVEEFYAFVERFHNDSIFQRNRLSEIVTGFDPEEDFLTDQEFESDTLTDQEFESDTIDVVEKPYYWDKEELWEYLKVADYFRKDPDFETRYSDEPEGKIREDIVIPGSGYRLSLKFKRMGNKWYLIDFMYIVL